MLEHNSQVVKIVKRDVDLFVIKEQSASIVYHAS